MIAATVPSGLMLEVVCEVVVEFVVVGEASVKEEDDEVVNLGDGASNEIPLASRHFRLFFFRALGVLMVLLLILEHSRLVLTPQSDLLVSEHRLAAKGQV